MGPEEAGLIQAMLLIKISLTFGIFLLEVMQGPGDLAPDLLAAERLRLQPCFL
jgi:hypothetical protein